MTAEEYLRRVDFWLRDVPWRLRRELVSELRGHLAELPADTDLPERLGSPEQYAADLRSAEGLERRRGLIAFLQARRPRNVVLVALGLTILGLSIGAIAWVDSYQPIAFSGSMANPADAKVGPVRNDELFIFRRGRPFRFGISIQNRGSFTVRVLGVPFASFVPFSARLLVSNPPYHGGTGVPMLPFRPFDLQPGEERLLLLRGVYACNTGMGAGGEVTLADFPVRFSFLWRTTTAEIPLDGTLTFAFRKGCPPRVVPPPTP